MALDAVGMTDGGGADTAVDASMDFAAPADALSDDDGAVAKQPGRVMCGPTICGPAMVCGAARSEFHTYTVSEFACVSVSGDPEAGIAGLVVAACDGPEDCASNMLCCADDHGGTGCRDSCATDMLCHSDQDCSEGERTKCKDVPDRFADAGTTSPCTAHFTQPIPLSCAVPPGARVCTCPNDGLFCDGACRNASDPSHCGACGRRCVSGACCNGTCFDPRTDLNNCGVCGHACPSGEPCVGGACGPCACTDGTACCGESTCVDLQTDPRHCGLCGTECGPLNECLDGVCIARCGQGAERCEDGCVNLLEDPMSCGHCFARCSVGSSCSNGRCAAPPTCSAPELVSVTTDAGESIDVAITAPFSAGTSGGPVAPASSVVVTFRWAPPSVTEYVLPTLYWRSAVGRPWTEAARSGSASAGFSAKIPPLTTAGRIDFYLVAKCFNAGSDEVALPAAAGTTFSYGVR